MDVLKFQGLLPSAPPCLVLYIQGPHHTSSRYQTQQLPSSPLNTGFCTGRRTPRWDLFQLVRFLMGSTLTLCLILHQLSKTRDSFRPSVSHLAQALTKRKPSPCRSQPHRLPGASCRRPGLGVNRSSSSFALTGSFPLVRGHGLGTRVHIPLLPPS